MIIDHVHRIYHNLQIKQYMDAHHLPNHNLANRQNLHFTWKQELFEVSSSTCVYIYICLETQILLVGHDPWTYKGIYVIYSCINGCLVDFIKVCKIIYHITYWNMGSIEPVSTCLLFQANICPSISVNLLTTRGFFVHSVEIGSHPWNFLVTPKKKDDGFSCSWVHHKLLGLSIWVLWWCFGKFDIIVYINGVHFQDITSILELFIFNYIK